ncbi:MAG: GTP-binding protein [Promethearchaeota archaeon]
MQLNSILQIWDLGGQERFEFFKHDYLKGANCVILVFDLARPDSFKKLDYYLKEIRELNAAIPIIVVGNKKDLEEEIGQIVSDDEINSWMADNNLKHFIKTSAKFNINIEHLFLESIFKSFLGLRLPLKPGICRNNLFRFKIVFTGTAGVGKTSIIKRFTENAFTEEYKLTVGVDFVTKNILINLKDLSKDILLKIQKIMKSQLKSKKDPSEKESIKSFLGAIKDTLKNLEKSSFDKEIGTKVAFPRHLDEEYDETKLNKELNKKLAIVILLLAIMTLVLILILL